MAPPRQHLSRAYLNVPDCVMHLWPIPMVVCNNIPRDIPERDPPYVLCENRSWIQSLTLMRSAIEVCYNWGLQLHVMTPVYRDLPPHPELPQQETIVQSHNEHIGRLGHFYRFNSLHMAA